MATPRHRRTPPPASSQVGQGSRVPVIDIYARISRAVDGSTIKVDHQVELGEEAIKERGARIGEVFRDPSMSAWNPKVIRRKWVRLMERLESGASDGVWVLDATRFSRKPIEGERLIEVAANGAKVWSYSSEYDLTTADGRSAFRNAMNRAAEESDRNSERIQRGKLRRARKGRVHGGIRGYAMPGFGPKPDGWDPDEVRLPESAERIEAEREIVRDAYRRLLAGTVSMVRLAGELNERGQAGERAALPVAGGFWTNTTLARSLTRSALAGKLIHKGEDMGTLAGAEPVVS
jgi:site-specific DNA recombinase